MVVELAEPWFFELLRAKTPQAPFPSWLHVGSIWRSSENLMRIESVLEREPRHGGGV